MLQFKQILNSKLLPKSVQICTCRMSSEDVPAKRLMPKDLTQNTDLTTKALAKRKLVTKEELQWRTPWHQKEGQRFEVLRTFHTDENHVNLIKWLQQDINLSPTAIRNWYAKRLERKKIMLQSYIPERNQILGNELAAAHFIVFRGGSVKFFGEDKWVKADENQQYNLPKHHEDDMFIQAIDCSDMEIYYEGLVNLENLKQVEWLSLNGCEELDDWSLDRITNIFSENLLYMDLRNMPKISYRGLGALYKMKKLKILYLSNEIGNEEFELTCLMLEEIMPELDIRIEKISFEIK